MLIGAIISVLSAGLMAYGGTWIAALLPIPAQKMLIAFALFAAAFELAKKVKIKPEKEPTQSKGAFAIVLGAVQLHDAARFAIFAFAAASSLAPTLGAATAGMGGALGGIAALYMGWTLGDELEEKFPLRMIRIGLAIVAVIAAVLIGLSARGLIF